MSKLCMQTMIQSFNGISFYGEKRGEQEFLYYSELLESDLKALGENKGNYEQKFIDKVMNIFHKQMSCTSAFIVGPANYNIRRHNKKWYSRDKALSDFEHWRKKYFKAVNRVRTLSPEDEIDKAVKEIDKLIVYRDFMKEANKIIKKGKLTTLATESNTPKQQEQASELVELFKTQYPDDKALLMAQELLKPDCFNHVGFASYTITSATTKIRERKKKIEVMKSRIEAKENQETIYFNGGSIYIENDRVIIAHDEKPEREIIQAIKSNGFRYSPKFQNWCRKHTANARYSADYLLNNVFGGKIERA